MDAETDHVKGTFVKQAGPNSFLRSQQDYSALTSFIIVAAQSVKNTATAENKGYDAGKKISGD